MSCSKKRRLIAATALLGGTIVGVAVWASGERVRSPSHTRAVVGESRAKTSLLGVDLEGSRHLRSEDEPEVHDPLLAALTTVREYLAGVEGALVPTQAAGVILPVYERVPGELQKAFLRDVAVVSYAQHRESLEGVMSVFSRLREKQQMVQAVVDEWVEERPQELAQWVVSLADPSLRSRALETLGREWAARDLETALNWAESLVRQSPDDGASLDGVVWHWVREAPEVAWNYAEMLDDTALRRRVSGKALRGWANTDPQAATLRAVSLTDSSEREVLVDYSVARWAERDPGAARTWVESVVEDVSLQAAGANALVRVWGHRDPASATRWVMEHGEAAADQSVLLQVSRLWAQRDPEAVARWISEQAASSRRLAVMDNISRVLADKDPEHVQSWLAAIEDPKLRSRGQAYLDQRGEVESSRVASRS